jgi:outer membrane protein assembly factor BamB
MRLSTNIHFRPAAMILLAILLIQHRYLIANDWPRFRGNSANNAEGLEQNITRSSISTMQLRWQFSTGAPVVASPVVATVNNVAMVFVGSENHIFYALNASTGTQVWTITTGGAITTAADVDTGNPSLGPVVYFASGDGCIYAASAASGSIFWTHCYGSGVSFFAPLFPVGGPSLGISYNFGNSGVIQALNPNTGATVWSFTSGAPFVSSPSIGEGGFPGGGVLVATTSTQLLALGGSGNLLSTLNLNAPAVGYSVQVVIGSREDDTCATFDTRTVWVAQSAGSNVYLVPLDTNLGFTTPTIVALGSPITAGPASFFLFSSATRTFRDPDTGLLITCSMFGSGNESFYPSASSILEAVVIQNSGSAAAGGHETVGSSALNIEPTFSLDETNPFGGSGVVFVPSQSGILYAVTIAAGAVTPMFTAHGAIEGSVAIGASRLYFADDAGFIYAVSPNGQ